MIENIVITGFDGILKTLPSLIIFGLVFKLLISVVSKGLVYFLLWKYKAELIQFILGSKARMVASDIGNKVEKESQRLEKWLHKYHLEVFHLLNTLETLP